MKRTESSYFSPIQTKEEVNGELSGYLSLTSHNLICYIGQNSLNSAILLSELYRKIHYLTREFRVKLHAKTDIARIARDECDIGFQVQFNVEFSSQVMNFP